MDGADLDLGYRRSALAAGAGGRRGRDRPDDGDRVASEAEIAEIVRWRRDNQPGGQNAGSVFTNPPGDSAGRLDRRGRVQGPPIGTARGVRRSTPTSSSPTPAAVPTTCAALMREVRRRVARPARDVARAGDAAGRVRGRNRDHDRAAADRAPRPAGPAADRSPHPSPEDRRAARGGPAPAAAAAAPGDPAGRGARVVGWRPAAPLLDVDHIEVRGAERAVRRRRAGGIGHRGRRPDDRCGDRSAVDAVEARAMGGDGRGVAALAAIGSRSSSPSGWRSAYSPGPTAHGGRSTPTAGCSSSSPTAVGPWPSRARAGRSALVAGADAGGRRPPCRAGRHAAARRRCGRSTAAWCSTRTTTWRCGWWGRPRARPPRLGRRAGRQAARRGHRARNRRPRLRGRARRARASAPVLTSVPRCG